MKATDEKKTPQLAGFFYITSLTITYFHTGCSTIIGAKSFHGPVRDGKGWDRLAMVIRHDLYELRGLWSRALNLEEVKLGSNCRVNKQRCILDLTIPAKVIGTSRTGN